MTEQPGASAPVPSPDAAVPPSDASVPPLEASVPPRRKRRLLRWFGWSFASLGVLALIGLSAYLVVVSNQWSDRVDELTVISEDLGQSVADARAAQADAEARMDIARVELENATTRITDLANEEAQAKDRESVLIDYVDAMISCADGRAVVIKVLTTRYVFDDGRSASAHARELDAYCDDVSSQFSAFKEEIAQ
ncbi:hypothetical protein [Demequina sp.]|uniref:hypothetical protein n=1 Tax=Demequina sp. TaxID=2050685 RepID=UPI0025C1E823|nr:hypothetical protein [Demequina sp.]